MGCAKNERGLSQFHNRFEGTYHAYPVSVFYCWKNNYENKTYCFNAGYAACVGL